jgi:hypothetical protein
MGFTNEGLGFVAYGFRLGLRVSSLGFTEGGMRESEDRSVEAPFARTS